MRKIVWMKILWFMLVSVVQAQTSKEYFLINHQPVFIDKIRQEALLVLDAPLEKKQIRSKQIQELIHLYGPKTPENKTHMLLKFPRKDLKKAKEMIAALQHTSEIEGVYPAYSLRGEKVYLSNQVILKTSPDVDMLTLHAIITKHQASLSTHHPEADGTVYLLKLPPERDLFALIHELDEHSWVQFSEPDLIATSPLGGYSETHHRTHASFDSTDDPYVGNQWFLHQASDADIDAPEAWNIQEGDSTVVIAVIDVHGFDLLHEDLRENIYRPYNAVRNNASPTPQNQFARHGTPCAGLIAAVNNNQIGIASIGGKIKVMPILIGEGVRADGLTYVRSSSYLKAAEHIVKTPNVFAVSNSFAATTLTNALLYSYNRMQKEGREGLGTVVLASSGNWNRKNQAIYPYYLPGVIGVGATNSRDLRTGFSNYGDSLDLVAPGEHMYTTLNDQQYGYFGGTSASCPLVAGLVGLMASQQPQLTASQLAGVLLRSCDKLEKYPSDHPQKQFGAWNEEVGYGRINAHQSLLNINTLRPPSPPDFIQASAISPQHIVVEWRHERQGNVQFFIERAVGSPTYFQGIAQHQKELTRFQDTGLQENTQYYYRIQARDEEGISVYSDTVAAKTPGRPNTPTNFSATFSSSQYIILRWETPSTPDEVRSWKIRRYQRLGRSLEVDTVWTLNTPTSSRYVDQSIQVPGWYAYDIQALNAYGNSPASRQIQIAPGAIVMQNDTLVSCRELILDPGGASEYPNDENVICCLKPGVNDQRIEVDFLEFDLESNKDFLHIYDGVELGAESYLGSYSGGGIPPKIRANNPEGILSLHFTSDQRVTRKGWQAKITCVPYPPEPPTNLRIDTLLGNELKLRWEDRSMQETGFEVWRQANDVPGFQKLHTTAANDTVFVDTTLDPGVYYTYKINAKNAGGESTFTNEVSAGIQPKQLGVNGAWVKKANFQRVQGGIGFAIADTGYVLNPLGELWAYLPKEGFLGQWVQKSTFPGRGRFNPVAVVIDEKAYLGLGFFMDDFWEYDPRTDTWQQMDFYPDGFERYHLIAFAIGNKGYVGIGDGEKDLWEFDPKAPPGKQWQRMADMPQEASRRYFPVAFSIGSTGYVGTGFYRQYLSDVWSFTPRGGQKGTWHRKADLPEKRVEANAFAIGDKGYIGTGSQGKKLRDFWEYDPVRNAWEQKNVFGGSSRTLAYAFAIRDKGYLGGGTGGEDFWEYYPTGNPGAPNAPEDLHATINTTQDTVNLKWTDTSIDEVGFAIWRKELPQNEFVHIGNANTGVTFFQDPTIQFGKQYAYAVSAYNFIDASARSTPDTVTVLPDPPQAPLHLQAKALNDRQINIRWENNDEQATHTLVYRWDLVQSRFEKIVELPATTSSFVDRGLEPNTFYRYVVQASNAGGVSVLSNAIGDTTHRSLPPPPELLKAEAVSGQSIQVSWEDWSSLADAYEVFRWQDSVQRFVFLRTLPASENSFLDEGLLPGTSYTYMVRAKNSAGYSSFSTEVSTFTQFESPLPPSGLSAKGISSHQVQLEWIDNAVNEEYFILEVFSEGQFTVLDTVEANNTFYQHSGLAAETEYLYRVKAENQFGSYSYTHLGYSNQAKAVTLGLSLDTLLTVPTQLRAHPTTNNSLEIQWDGTLSDQETYELFQRNNGQVRFEKIAETRENSFVQTALFENSRYQYRVRRRRLDSVSRFSKVATGLTLPNPPRQFQGSISGDDGIWLTWENTNPMENPCSLILERAEQAFQNFDVLARIPLTQSYYLDAKLRKTAYLYRLRAENTSGFSTYSPSLNVDFSEDPGQVPEETLRLKPNPVRKKLTVEFYDAETGTLSVHIFNAQGKQVFITHQEKTAESSVLQLSLGFLSTGNYLMQLRLGGNTWEKRFVKQ